MCAVAEGLPAIQRDLMRYALVLTRNATDADDLVQDTCLRALRFTDGFEAGTSLQRWCFGIMRNLHIDNRRSGWRRSSYLEQMGATAATVIDGGQEAAVMLREALGLAGDAALMLADGEGATIAELAAAYSKPTGTVKNRLHRGRKALRAAFGLDERTPAPCKPRRRAVDLTARDAEIVAAHEARQSISDIARRYRLSRLRIRQIVRAQQAEAQLEAA